MDLVNDIVLCYRARTSILWSITRTWSTTLLTVIEPVHPVDGALHGLGQRHCSLLYSPYIQLMEHYTDLVNDIVLCYRARTSSRWSITRTWSTTMFSVIEPVHPVDGALHGLGQRHCSLL